MNWLHLTLLLLDQYKSHDNDLPNIPYDSIWTLFTLFHKNQEQEELDNDCYDVLSYIYGELERKIKARSIGQWWKNITREQAVEAYKRIQQYQQLHIC